MDIPPFDEFSKMAEDEPEKFEEICRQLKEDFFASIPPEQRVKYEQLQWKIDGEARKYKNPYKRALVVYNMMNESLKKLNAAYNGSR